MLKRKEGKAANEWVKIERPIITSGEKAGQRDSERITARVLVIGETAFTPFGERKLNGFTLDELKGCLESGEDLIIKNPEGTVTARVSVGQNIDQFSRSELKEIIEAVDESGILLVESPVDQADLERMGRTQARVKGGKRAAKPANASTRSSNAGQAD